MGLAGVLALRDALKRQNAYQRLSVFRSWLHTPDGLERMAYYVVLVIGIPFIPVGLVLFVALPADYLGKLAVWLVYRKKP